MKWQKLLACSGGAFTAFLAFVWYRSTFYSLGQALVQGAGSVEANGFYIGQSSDQYRQPQAPWPLSKVPDTTESWRLYDKLHWSSYILTYQRDIQSWSIGKSSGSALYTVKDSVNVGATRRPPVIGWETKSSGAAPVPTLRSVGALPTPESARWKKVSPQIKLAYERPGSILLLIIIIYYAYHIWAARQNGEKVRVACSYTSVMHEREYWRTITASFAHLDLLHLAFNCLSLHALSGLEDQLGTEGYLTLSMELVVLTMLLNLMLYRFLALARNRPQMLAQRGVGYSCVLFAWMVAESVWSRQYCPIGGLPSLCFPTWTLPLPSPFNLPFNIAPIFLLFITSLIMPNASFVGHLSGVILGYLLVWQILPIPNPLLVTSLATSVIYLNERIFPWQSPDLPTLASSSSSSVSSSSSTTTSNSLLRPSSSSSTTPSSPLPPQWPSRTLTSLAWTQIAISLLSITSHSLTTVLTSLLPPFFLLCALRRLPYSRPLFLTLPLLIIYTLVSLAGLASSLARGPFYSQLGLSISTLLLGQVLFGLRALLSTTSLALSFCVLASLREGQASLKEVGIEMGEVGSGGPAVPAFSGSGRTLGRAGGRKLGAEGGDVLGGMKGLDSISRIEHLRLLGKSDTDKVALIL